MRESPELFSAATLHSISGCWLHTGDNRTSQPKGLGLQIRFLSPHPASAPCTREVRIGRKLRPLEPVLAFATSTAQAPANEVGCLCVRPPEERGVHRMPSAMTSPRRRKQTLSLRPGAQRPMLQRSVADSEHMSPLWSPIRSACRCSACGRSRLDSRHGLCRCGRLCLSFTCRRIGCWRSGGLGGSRRCRGAC